MAEALANQQELRQQLNIPNINIQPASSGDDDSSSDDEKARPIEKGEAEGESDDTGDDTSTWDSDPATPSPRSTREYYPLKGSAEKIYPSPGGDNASDDKTGVKLGHSVDLYLKTLSDHLGDGDSNPNGDNDLSGIPLSAYRRVVDGGEDSEQEKQLQDENEEDEELKHLQEDGEEEEEEEGRTLKSLILPTNMATITKEKMAPVILVPSLDAMGSNSIGVLMSHLIGNQPSLFQSQDSSSVEEEDAAAGEVMYGKKFEGSEDSHDGQLQKWEELFRLLEIQHQQQLLLQSEQHERRMEHLKQLMSQQQLELQELQHHDLSGAEGLNSQTNKQPMAESPQHPHYVAGDDDKEVTTPRNEYSLEQQYRDTGSGAIIGESDSEDSDTANQGNIPEQRNYTAASDTHIDLSALADQQTGHKGMTTWSDIKDQRSDTGRQRSRPANENNMPTQQLSMSVGEEDEVKQEDQAVSRRYEELQNHYEKEKESLQKQYEDQLQAVQRQWYQLQQQQQEQQQVLHHLLARQQERIEHQQRALKRQRETLPKDDEDRTPTGTPDRLLEGSDSDGSSNAYSNFTYWKMKEEDTYKALPLTPEKEETILDEDKMAPSLRLKEKHARHVADLKAYYESEIQDLKAQLTETSNLKDYSPSKALERTNERLQQNCAKLEAALTFANSRIQDLEKTVAALGERLEEEPDERTTAANTIHSLQQTTDDLKQLCHQKDAHLQELVKRNHKLQISLEQSYQLQDVHAKEDQRDQRMLNRVMAEYKTLAQDHELAKAQLGATEMQLYDAKAEVAELKRKVSHLEVEVKRLSHERDKTQHRGMTSGSGSILTLSGPDQHSSHTAPSPEERKFLKSTAGYNVFTGEEVIDDTSSESLHQASDTESSQERSGKAPRSAERNRPPDLTLQPGPFDSDLDERPISPMMKAAAQFQRWQGEDVEFSGVIQDPPRTASGNESIESDDDEGDGTLQNVSTQTLNSVAEERRSETDHLSNSMGSPAVDSSIHIWPESEPRKKTTRSPDVKPPEREPATSPRQLARESLARYAKSQSSSHSNGLTNQSRSQSSSPRRNLASQFQAAAAAAEHERGSPLGSSDKMDSPLRSGYGHQIASSTSSRYSSRRGLLEGREGLSSTSSRNRSVTHMPAEKESSVETTLARVRAGDVLTRQDWQNGSVLQKSSGFSPRTPKNPEEIGNKIMQKLEEHERRLDELMLEKRKLESDLSHLPTSGRGARQQQEKVEDELEKVSRELGSVRMLLRKYNALKTS
ncbi:LOW QUALITY PROTEIN: uncharacterized protein [Amphiura filiformis]|uniref:LOW QUALITY PROTEIN: uncharacterized protein n=1 Tax=Amphiura filiformis TaxID=82378 RepID=UPI003B21035E